MAAATMTIERVMAFNGLDVLVARDEGLFAAEGLDLRIVLPAPADIRPPRRARSRGPSRTRDGSRSEATPSCSRGESAEITARWRKAE